METINEIRDRINDKKVDNKFFLFIKGILLIAVLILGFLIYARNDANASFINSVFHTNISFTKMNETIDLYISNLLSNFNIFTFNNNQEDETVNKEIEYIKLEENYYFTNANYVKCLTKGKVVKVDENIDTFSVTIFYKNEVTACYYDLLETFVKYQDEVNIDTFIGTYNAKFKVLFEKNGKLITYEEALLS